MSKCIANHAKRLGYQATVTKRGVRLYKSGGRHVLFRDEAAVRAYLNAIDTHNAKQLDLL